MTTVSMKDIRTALNFRHACKHFDPTRTISDDDISLILEAAHTSPTSYGFEQWNIIVTQDPTLRSAIKQASALANNPRFDASHILVFTAKTSAGVPPHIDHILKDVKKLPLPARAAFKTYWKQWAKKSFHLFKHDDSLHQWSARQAYIALGFAMLTAAERGIDSCAMEGFDIDKLSQVLADVNLINPATDQPVVILALGYRAGTQPKRSRRPIDEAIRVQSTNPEQA
ncbi:MAG: NAD(P)H-dependent oxidoreductase [Candidatus Saccharibacteria bacterium]|nr:NAD(P)H-dependent oxidoreductase [Candidatus Saccharibacteria bacterium]